MIFILKDNNILFKPFIIYLISILLMTSIGYGFKFDYLNEDINALNHFRHFLTTGTYGLVFYIVMIIISTIHRKKNIYKYLVKFWCLLLNSCNFY